MMLPQTAMCANCIDRQIAMTERILEVISDPANHAAERARLVELLRERGRMQEECDRMGFPVAQEGQNWTRPMNQVWPEVSGVGQEG